MLMKNNMCRSVNIVLCGVLVVTYVRIIWAECEGKSAFYNVLNGTIRLACDSATYLPNTHCEWLIQAPQPGQKIVLTFKGFDTECSFDYLKVYDGSSSQKRLLGSFSGSTTPPSIISNTSSVVLEFISDNNYVRKGSVIDFVITDCPRNCSGHGNCIGNVCYCNEWHTGVACDVEICPQLCNNATGNGQCSLQSGGCQCNAGYIGESCSFSLHDDVNTGGWHLISSHSPVFRSRFGHAGAYVESDNAFWIFGGSDLNEVLDDLVKFNFEANNWQAVQSSTGNRPAARFRHTLVPYKDSLVLFGGQFANGTLANDLWIFNISTATWQILKNNVDSPPGLASHCASLNDGELIVYGGERQDYGFSSEMYTYDLVLQNGWKRITYKLAKISDLRLVGHTCVFFPALRSLLVFGGYKIERHIKTLDTTLLYHVDGKVWFPVVTSGELKPRAYHSSVVIGDYMVTFGGLIHTHYKDETCYGDEISLLNLRNFTWTSILSIGDARNGSWINVRGRYSHVATVFNRSTLLVAGGFSGTSNSDILAYKMPSNLIHNDPASIQMCPTFTQCVTCLTWGSQGNLLCGWCVQDSTCYPRNSPSGPCSSSEATRGWWGDRGSFLTAVDKCRIDDSPPGLMSSITFYERLDDVVLVNPLREEFYTSPRRVLKTNKKSIKVTWKGFIYPVISKSTAPPVSLMFRTGKMSASLHLSTDESAENTEKVISFKSSSDGEILLSEKASRRNGLPLFPNATGNKKYYIEVKVAFEKTVKQPFFAVLTDDMSVVDGRYVRPYYSDDCGKYTRCLECLSDVSCGWCSSRNTCEIARNSSVKCSDGLSGEEIYLVLNTTYCETCAQYIDCESCSEDDVCIWRSAPGVLGHCFHLQPEDKKEEAKTCLPSCTSYKDCTSCLMNTKCLWCENQHACIPWTSYPVSFMFGQCSHWSDSSTKESRCYMCSEQNTCADCWRARQCGWCGEFHNGRCFLGGYQAPDSGSCSQLMHSNGTSNNYTSYNWSYVECPDENECITKNDCHKDAECFDVVGSYRCECRQGYEGDGKFCKALCNPPCVHGTCNKHELNDSLDECVCDLGWAGPVCSQDCGCHNHSTCHTGIGVCDKCQGLTRGNNCEFCVPGSFGEATSPLGCARCECNGHGDEQRGICDDKTGHCFCMNNTMGVRCDQCSPGFSGYPEKGEGCYSPCKALHSILSNMTQGALSSLPEPGQNYDPRNMNCVWIITTSTNKSDNLVYSNDLAPGTITFKMKDITLDCQTDHVYVYDGMPNFKLSTVGAKSSARLIGSLCGTDASNIPTIESGSGTLVVVFKGNVGQHPRSHGFNASFVLNLCPNACAGNRYCHSSGSCVCKPGWTRPGCDHVLCPANCSAHIAQGHCDESSGGCVCKVGFGGPSCSVEHAFDGFSWEYISNVSGSSSHLARMGHTMTADIQRESLIIYGGYSLYFGIFGDVWTYDTKTKSYAQDYSWSTKPSPRYFHAAAIYKRTMYVSGGKTEKGYSSEMWKYDLDSKQWQKSQNLPGEMAGHTMNVINDTMYLIGGYSPVEQCSSNVYTFKLDVSGSPWTDLNPSGDIFDVCFGHSTVYDRHTKSLVVFGKKGIKMEPTLAVLKLTSNNWDIVSGVSQALLRYFHVSMLIDDVMILMGGYTGQDVQDFAHQPLVYDLRCETWHKPDLKGSAPSSLTHGAIASVNEITYFFGGYNGLSSDKLFRQNISFNWCSMFTTEVSCRSVKRCVWCQDTSSNLTACYISNNHPRLNCTTANSNGICPNAAVAMPVASAMTSRTDMCTGESARGGCSNCIQDAGGSSTCSWSIDSHQCFSLHFQPITCPFGICGRVLRHYDVCPKSCNNNSYCYDCLQQYNCGWCTDATQNGQGVCTEGTLQGPFNGSCYGKNNDVTTWVSSVCLPENECVNGHHRCNENETCIDMDFTYKCECLPGYERKNGSCRPVCSEGCINGICIDPDKCLCNFGWVGTNCSTACQCHGKGHCLIETQLDECIDCRNNTTGNSCHRCLPGYVGQDGQCTSCYEKCYRNAEVCYDPDEKNTTEGRLFGPIDDGSYFKCECNEKSEGNYCEYCKNGFFQSDRKCIKCKCRGHSGSCHKTTGLDCDCKNNTRTQDFLDNTNQCSLCNPSYLGSPKIQGQQCYRDVKILGLRSLARKDSKYLLPFQTNFFYIFPSYTNTDIRLTIDVSEGLLDCYVSFADNAFKVDANQSITISLTKVTIPELYSDGLNKYARFSGDTQVIVVKEIKHRLVVTFPHDEHQMDKKKFYIVIKAGQSGAKGMLYFKQDTTKINLIVFFIVFASCFVFLLSVICIGWSAKNHIHSRQEVHNQEIENERMHNRPFARYSFLFEYQAPTRSVMRHRKTTASTRKAVRPLGVQCTNDYHATVTTVMFQMPQTEKTKMTVSLGTTLALVSPQQLDKLAQPSPKELRATTNL